MCNRVLNLDQLQTQLHDQVNSEIEFNTGIIRSLTDQDCASISFPPSIANDIFNPDISSFYQNVRCSVFRGQRNSSWVCESGLMRGNICEYHKLLALIKAHIFSSSLIQTEKYNYYFESTGESDSGGKATHLYLENPEIAFQELGKKTLLVDFTMDPDIALFFACTEKDQNGNYVPVSDDIEVPYGSIFVSSVSPTNGRKHNNANPMVLGPSMLSRNRDQMGFMQKQSNINPSNVDKLVFRHDADFSEEIYNKFDGGKKLFTDDCLDFSPVFRYIDQTYSDNGSTVPLSAVIFASNELGIDKTRGVKILEAGKIRVRDNHEDTDMISMLDKILKDWNPPNMDKFCMNVKKIKKNKPTICGMYDLLSSLYFDQVDSSKIYGLLSKSFLFY